MFDPKFLLLKNQKYNLFKYNQKNYYILNYKYNFPIEDNLIIQDFLDSSNYINILDSIYDILLNNTTLNTVNLTTNTTTNKIYSKIQNSKDFKSLQTFIQNKSNSKNTAIKQIIEEILKLYNILQINEDSNNINQKYIINIKLNIASYTEGMSTKEVIKSLCPYKAKQLDFMINKYINDPSNNNIIKNIFKSQSEIDYTNNTKNNEYYLFRKLPESKIEKNVIRKKSFKVEQIKGGNKSYTRKNNIC